MPASKLYLVVLCVLCAQGCAGSPGEIAHELRESGDFMTSRQPLYVVQPDGEVSAYLPDGRALGSVIAPGYHILAASSDGRVFALGDSDTNLYIHHREAGQTQAVRHKELLGRVGDVALSPSSELFAVTRHADFSKPQATWESDDRIYLVDVKSGEVKEIINESARKIGTINRLIWGDDGEHLYYSAWSLDDGEHRDWRVKVTLSTEAREELSQEEWERIETPDRWRWAWKAHPIECPEVGVLSQDDTGLYLAASQGAEQRVLVSVKGRKRGFHDHFATIPSYHFLPGCDEVVFVHNETVYGYKISEDALGALTRGGETWFFKDEPARQE